MGHDAGGGGAFSMNSKCLKLIYGLRGRGKVVLTFLLLCGSRS